MASRPTSSRCGRPGDCEKMSVEYTSRTGKHYYLLGKTTKAGNPGYFFSTKPDGQRVASIPAGYEIYENVNGQVFLRKKTAPVILPKELALVESALHRHGKAWRFWMEARKTMIVVYMAGDMDGLDKLSMEFRRRSLSDTEKLPFAHYTAMLRFNLIDKKARIFVAERFCFRGSVDDWIPIAGPNTLAAHVRKFVKHLGQESFYDLY